MRNVCREQLVRLFVCVPIYRSNAQHNEKSRLTCCCCCCCVLLGALSFFLSSFLFIITVCVYTCTKTQHKSFLAIFLFKVASCCVRERVPAILFIVFPYFSTIVVQVGNIREDKKIRETFILHYYLSIYYSSNGRQAFSSVNTPANVLVHNHIPTTSDSCMYSSIPHFCKVCVVALTK